MSLLRNILLFILEIRHTFLYNKALSRSYVNNHCEVNQSLFIINLVVILMCLCSDVGHESAGGCDLL